MKDCIKTFCKGLAVGVANIIPGVSGGTMALILGIYERCLAAVSALRPVTVKKLCGIFSKKTERRAEAFEEIKRIDLLFLIILAVGAGVAIVALAKVMIILLNNFHDPTYGFFFGLVLASALVPWKMVKKTTVMVVLMALVGAGLGVGSDFLISPENKIANAEHKAAVTALKIEKKACEKENDLACLKIVEEKLAATGGNQVSAAFYGKLVGAGALAISAMILPGISGSFLLLAMGLYFDILAAISGFNIPVIFCFGLGCLLGLLAFSHFLNWLLKKAADPTMGFLTGLMVGSLWTIWPFRVSYTLNHGSSEVIYLANRWPDVFGLNEILTIVTVLAGVALVAAFIRYEKKHKVGEDNVQ